MSSIEYVFENDLLPDEIVLWSGKPDPNKLFIGIDIFLIPFTFLWFGFAIFWTVTALTGAGLFGVFGLPFVIIGFYVSIGRFIIKVRRKKRTRYAITNLRIISILVNSEGKRITSAAADLKNISNEIISVNRSKSGTIFFGSMPYLYRMYLNTGLEFFMGGRQNDIVAFYDIIDADEVYEIYKKAKYSDKIQK